MQSELIVFNIDPICFYRSIVPKMLVFRLGLYPRYISRIELIIDGASLYLP
jgi:hypothetical protein